MKKLGKKQFSLLTTTVTIIMVLSLLLSACGGSKKADAPKELFSGTPQELFAHVEGTALRNCISSLAGSSAAADTGAEVEMRMQAGPFLMTMIESMAGMGDLDFLNDIFIRYRFFTQDELMSLAATVGLGQQDVLRLDGIIDGNDTTYLRFPELLSDYLKVTDPSVKMTTTDEGDRVAVSAPQADMAVAAPQLAMREVLERLLSSKDLQKLINTLIDTALAQITNVTQTTETVTVGGVSQEQTVLTATISEADITNMGIAILEKTKTDEAIQNILMTLVAASPEADFRAQMQADLDEAIAELTAGLEHCNPGNYILFKTYLGKSQNVMGRNISVHSADEAPFELIDYRSAESKGTTAAKMTFGYAFFKADFVLEGSETKTDGNYALTFNNQKLATLQLSNLSETGGTLRLIPEKALLDMFMDGADMPIPMLDQIALVIDYQGKGDSSELGLQLELNNELLVGFSLKGKSVKAEKITVPTQFLDMNNMEDQIKFYQQMNPTAILENLVKAGVPESFLAALAQAG